MEEGKLGGFALASFSAHIPHTPTTLSNPKACLSRVAYMPIHAVIRSEIPLYSKFAPEASTLFRPYCWMPIQKRCRPRDITDKVLVDFYSLKAVPNE